MERPCEPHLMTGPAIQKLETESIRKRKLCFKRIKILNRKKKHIIYRHRMMKMRLIYGCHRFERFVGRSDRFEIRRPNQTNQMHVHFFLCIRNECHETIIKQLQIIKFMRLKNSIFGKT